MSTFYSDNRPEAELVEPDRVPKCHICTEDSVGLFRGKEHCADHYAREMRGLIYDYKRMEARQ